MCGRYGLTRDVDELDARLRLPVLREASQRYNIAPTEDVLYCRRSEGRAPGRDDARDLFLRSGRSR